MGGGDRHTHKLTGRHELNPEQKALFERCVAFLDSDLEYEWPAIQWASFSQAILRLIGLRRIANWRAGDWTEKKGKFGRLELGHSSEKKISPSLSEPELIECKRVGIAATLALEGSRPALRLTLIVVFTVSVGLISSTAREGGITPCP